VARDAGGAASAIRTRRLAMTEKRRRSRGFTLIELMVVVCLIGILSSIAIPEFDRLNLRARTAERRTIMTAIERCMSDVSLNSGTVPTVTGDWNPAGTVKPWTRPFDPLQAGWTILHLQIEGKLYYSYHFVSSNDGSTPTPTLYIQSVGDLDGDGVESSKSISYVAFGHSYQWVSEDPPEGSEDAATF